MVLLDNDAFISELSSLFQKSRLKGSVTVTMKKYNGIERPMPRDHKELPVSNEYFCLMRAVSRSKKIATVIHQKDITKFHSAYFSLVRGNMDGLKKVKKAKGKPKAT